MGSWSAVVKKDFRLTKTVFVVGLVINLLFLMLALFIDRSTGEIIYVFIPMIAAVGLHIFYLPILLFVSLRKEGDQLHLWLHNPQSTARLLLSKVLNGMLMSVVSLIILYSISGMLLVSRFSLIEAYWTDTWKASMYLFPHILLISLMIGVWVILLWSLYHALKYRIGRWTWLALLGAVIVPGWISTLWNSSELYKQLTQWMGTEITFSTFNTEPIPIYTGEYLYHFIIILGLFYLSAWIIDRKVEE